MLSFLGNTTLSNASFLPKENAKVPSTLRKDQSRNKADRFIYGKSCLCITHNRREPAEASF